MIRRVMATVAAVVESRNALKVVSWNIGALQTNPFEFWSSTPDVKQCMEAADRTVDLLMTVPLHFVFTKRMFDSLPVKWPRTTPQSLWDRELSRISLGSLLTDPAIGTKRFVSWPDRFTRSASGRVRPSVVTGFEGDLSSVEVWWAQWMEYMSSVGVNAMRPLDMGKYGHTLTEEENAAFDSDQIAWLAAFDAALVHVMSISKCSQWEGVAKREDAKYKEKDAEILRVLQSKYSNADIVMLQEVGNIDAYTRAYEGTHHVVVAPGGAARQQASVCILHRNVFTDVDVMDVPSSRLSAGDLCAVVAKHARSNEHVMIASFHGDTNGNSTISVVQSILDTAHSRGIARLLLGADLNTHTSASVGTLSHSAFLEFCKSSRLEMSNAAGLPTVKSARTVLQPQSHKSMRTGRITYDTHPKDSIVTSMKLLTQWIDNTGQGAYEAGRELPNDSIKSDHAIVYAEVAVGSSRDEL